jgi:transaldolase/glucose-6-phosphate isomerase
MKLRLPAALAAGHRDALSAWRGRGGTRRLLEHDASLWTGGDEARWLGWLDAPSAAGADLPLWSELGADARTGGFRHALVLGMGGSSLAPEVQRAALPRGPGHPEILVLDSIHPDQVAAVGRCIDPAATLVVVASKSGSTLEPNLLMEHFLERVAGAIGAPEAARRFVAITDPGSALDRLARGRGFRRVVPGEPSIGGRFSALSPFGLVPAALQGIPADEWLARAASLAAACRGDDPARNPGAALGLLLAAAAATGRDKLTLVAHPQLAPLGAWLEQLVAESTGKNGRAVLPCEGEPLGAPAIYGVDRLFVAIRLAGALGAGDDARLDALAAAGHPVAELDVASPLDLGAEFYRWEFATAVAGAELGVNPFDQPDVESAKAEARRLTAEVERTGALPAERAFWEGGGCALFAPEEQARVLLAGAGRRPGLGALLRAHFDRLRPGDYAALLLFCPMVDENLAAAARLRAAVRDARHVATSVGFGPRYLHSTGQAHKGGPDKGVFLVITDEPAADLPVPGQRLTFGQALAAQARGDAEVLARLGRRVLRVHLPGPAASRLPELVAAATEFLR